jgi:hypothetical protein
MEENKELDDFSSVKINRSAIQGLKRQQTAAAASISYNGKSTPKNYALSTHNSDFGLTK